jgi:hypothetical protein
MTLLETSDFTPGKVLYVPHDAFEQGGVANVMATLIMAAPEEAHDTGSCLMIGASFGNHGKHDSSAIPTPAEITHGFANTS